MDFARAARDDEIKNSEELSEGETVDEPEGSADGSGDGTMSSRRRRNPDYYNDPYNPRVVIYNTLLLIGVSFCKIATTYLHNYPCNHILRRGKW